MNNKGCEKLERDGKIYYKCYFEYSWEVNNVSQAKYFFHIIIEVDTTLKSALGADFVPSVY